MDALRRPGRRVVRHRMYLVPALDEVAEPALDMDAVRIGDHAQAQPAVSRNRFDHRETSRFLLRTLRLSQGESLTGGLNVAAQIVASDEHRLPDRAAGEPSIRDQR